MASSINASTSGAGGLITTADNTGNLNIQSAGSTVLALTSSGTTVTGTGSYSGNLSFNSGYGSSAVAYGCRAWVNFNGTSTVAIRASGNVSSITDNGTGDYTVNFTTAMPDANYSAVSNVSAETANIYSSSIKYAVSPTTTAYRLVTGLVGTAFADCSIVDVSIFR